MALITHSTPSMIGGVSQQPATQRFASQCELQENALGTVIEGLRKRPPTEHVGTLASAPTGSAAYHTINRDPVERYQVAVSNKALRVYDMVDGATKTVNNIDGDPATVGAGGDFDYLETTDPATDIEFLTIADYTIVVNKAKQVTMSSAVTADRGPEALAFVRQGNYTTKYILEVDGRVVTYTSEDSDAAAAAADSLQTDHIASALAAPLTASPGGDLAGGGHVSASGVALDPTDYDITVEGSTIWVKRADGADFEIRTDDSVASTVVTVIKDSVQTFTELPQIAPNGFTIKVTGLPDQGFADAAAYYVEFQTTDEAADAFEKGTWEESRLGGIEYQISAATAPHVLIRLSTGDFLWAAADGSTYSQEDPDLVVPKWGELEAGDTATNPLPAFISTSAGDGGELIRGVSFYKDRLVLLAGETVVLSESGQYFNFFRTTVTTVLDSARMSVVAAHTRVNLLNYAVPFMGHLVCFSEFSQFLLTGGQDGTLTPTNVSVSHTSEYESTLNVRPVAAKRSIFFTGTRGENTTVRELYDASNNRPQYEAVDITGQCPSYVAGATEHLVVSPTEECLVVKAAAQDTLYIYKWMVNGGERVQSAWSKFTLSGDTPQILATEWVDQYLYLVVRRGTQTSLERLDFEPFLADSGAAFRIHLDRRVRVVGGTYDKPTNSTTFAVPYNLTTGGTPQVVLTSTGTQKVGTTLPVTSSVSSPSASVTVSGDYGESTVYVGEVYTMRYRFSELHLQKSSDKYTASPITSASHRVRYGRLNYADSGYFTVTVTLKGADEYLYKWTGPALNEPGRLIGSINLETGLFKFPVMAKHDRVTVDLTNDTPLPSRFTSCEWESDLHSRVGARSRY
jgi:hypothetical protein